MAINEFALGDIVALKSHPFFRNLTSVLISGEPQLISPLMVVVEYIEETRDQYDEKTGDAITRKGNCQCKCIWFSNKTYQYEETWVSSKLLKVIKRNENVLNKDDLFSNVINSDATAAKDYLNVSFKTMALELRKHKISISHEEWLGYPNNEMKTTINPLLSFVSPIMEILQIVEDKESDRKDAKFDNRTGKQKRFTSKWAVKCKWFNPIADKMSEKFLPIEALSIVDKPDQSLLNYLQSVIDKEKYFKIKSSEDSSETIVQPISIVFRGGEYFLKAYDFKFNKNIELDINNSSFSEMENYYMVKVPSFGFLKKGSAAKSVIEELEECINQAKLKKALLRIKYINRNDKLSYKTIKNYSLLKTTEDRKPVFYLNGFCSSNKWEERTFRIDRIQHMQMLDLKYDD
jgi:hypothetical protein